MGDLTNLLFIVLGFVFVLASVALPRIVRPRAAAQASGQAQADRLDFRALERIDRSMVQLEETSRELFGRLDTRTRVLIRLLEDAEVKTQQLEQAVQRGRGGTA
ncbi:MAG: hypothetical protein L6Q71_00640 [Planctomycetes bacterium]|nr:hypothetical protein [Planctomycetota bacterium]NUQ35640.1 hypothetical protein [Planctomycetaceae bacterium]